MKTPALMQKLKQLLCLCSVACDLAVKAYDLYCKMTRP